MLQNILDYLKTQRVGVLAIEMMDGSPHSATLHFAYDEDSDKFFFKTHRSYRKSEPLLGRPISKASFVVGVSENDMRSFQTDGEVRLITEEEYELFQKIYLGKFPEKKKVNPDSEAVFFKLIPT